MLPALLPRDTSVYQALAGIRHQYATEHLDGRAFSRSVWADVAHDLSIPNGKGEVIQCADLLRLPPAEGFDGLFQSALPAGYAIGFAQMMDLYHRSASW